MECPMIQKGSEKSAVFTAWWFEQWNSITIMTTSWHWSCTPSKINSWNLKMGVSKNRGTPKWMVHNGKPYQNGWFGGTPIFGNIQMMVWSRWFSSGVFSGEPCFLLKSLTISWKWRFWPKKNPLNQLGSFSKGVVPQMAKQNEPIDLRVMKGPRHSPPQNAYVVYVLTVF